jgi:hypothetical protein
MISETGKNAFDELKARAILIGCVLDAFGPRFEHPAEQLADNLLAISRHFSVELRHGIANFTSAQDFVNHVSRSAHLAINGSVGEILALVKATRLKGESND